MKLMQRVLSCFCVRTNGNDDDFESEKDINESPMLPGDVKKGQFAVFAAKAQEPKKFVIKLEYLADPAFLRLLELAKEEYGFGQQGILAVPCQPEHLQKILQQNAEPVTQMLLQ